MTTILVSVKFYGFLARHVISTEPRGHLRITDICSTFDVLVCCVISSSRVESSLDKMLLIIQHNDSLSSKTKKYETLQTYANIQHFFEKKNKQHPVLIVLMVRVGGG